MPQSRSAHIVPPIGYRVKRLTSEHWSPVRRCTEVYPEVHDWQRLTLGAVTFATKAEAAEWCYLDAGSEIAQPI